MVNWCSGQEKAHYWTWAYTWIILCKAFVLSLWDIWNCAFVRSGQSLRQLEQDQCKSKARTADDYRGRWYASTAVDLQRLISIIKFRIWGQNVNISDTWYQYVSQYTNDIKEYYGLRLTFRTTHSTSYSCSNCIRWWLISYKDLRSF